MQLTKEHRENIVTQALRFRFREAEAAVEEARCALGPLMYSHLVPPKDEARVKAIGPDWQRWAFSTTQISIVHENFEDKGRFYARTRREDKLDQVLPLDAPRPFGAFEPFRDEDDGRMHTVFEIRKNHPLRSAFDKVVKQHHKLVNERNEVAVQLRALLNSRRTLKQLRAAWPEGERFFPAEPSKSTAVVSIGLSDQINKVLGLPEKADIATQAVRKAATS